MQKTGRVVIKTVSPGSKSERRAVCLSTEGGDLVLRRRGGHPFSDPVLEELAGKWIRAEGSSTRTHFILDDWEELEETD